MKRLISLTLFSCFFAHFLAGEDLIPSPPPPPTPLLEDRYVAVKPTVYLYIRAKLGGERDFEWKEILEKVYPKHGDIEWHLENNTYPWDSIIIIDEGDYWSVFLHVFGNGQLAPRDKAPLRKNIKPVFFQNPTQIIYLKKKTLEEIDRPANALNFSPIVID